MCFLLIGTCSTVMELKVSRLQTKRIEGLKNNKILFVLHRAERM